MGDPHNPARYGETWPQHKIDASLAVLESIKDFAVISGGWAWHFMSPKGHVELKHAHDHKDIDMLVPPQCVASTLTVLQQHGFEKVRTKYDRLPSDENFRRYEKTSPWFQCLNCSWVGDGPENDEWDHESLPYCPRCEGDCGDHSFRITIDFFVKQVPTLPTLAGFIVVRPDVLIGYYSQFHSSKACWAVLAAKTLFDKGELPINFVNRGELLAHPDLDIWYCGKCNWSGQFPITSGGTKLKICAECKRYACSNIGKPSYEAWTMLPHIRRAPVGAGGSDGEPAG